MPKRIDAWQCEWGCGGEHDSYSLIAEHEKECLFNPGVKSCFTCNKGDFCEIVVEKMDSGADLTNCPGWELFLLPRKGTD